MAKRDIITLLSPSVFFIVAAVVVFMYSTMIRQNSHDNGHKQKFETFATNVQTGKFQLTTDRWLEGMRREDDTAEAYRQLIATTGEMMQVICWAIAAGIFFQIAVVFSVKKRLGKP